METFAQLSPLLRPELLRALNELGFSQPTVIQQMALPILLSGADLIGKSRTGSGKTIAFSLPLLNQVNLENGPPQALVMCPTRELCDQVAREIRKLARHLPGLKVVLLVGGQPVFPQRHSLQRGAHVAVGTPGRILDHLRRKSLDLSEVRFLVLDEADRMLDMGFAEDMEAILSETPESRQTALFSATFPAGIERIGRKFLKKARQVEGQTQSLEIRQIAFAVEEKFPALLGCLQQEDPESALIFCNLKETVKEVSKRLSDMGTSVAALHGDLDQEERDRVMAQFRNGSLRFLVATDVAARGIDVAGLELVVNYDLPKPDNYVHRIGRTGRAGKIGLALSFVGKGEEHKVRRIQEETGMKIEKSQAPEASEDPLSPAKMLTLFIGGGRKEKLRPGDLLGALTGEAAGISATKVGKIEVHDHFTYLAVAREVGEKVLVRLRMGKIKGRKFRVEKVR